MRIIKLSLEIAICVLFISCSKDDIQLIYSSPYHKASIKTVNGPRVFSSNGEIGNQSVIRRLVINDTSLFSSMVNGLMNNLGILDTITFIDPQQAVLHHSFYNRHCRVSNKLGHFLLTSNDTTTGYTSNDALSQKVGYHIGQIKPDILTEFVYSSTAGIYNFGYTAKEKHMFAKKGNKVSAPIILYVQHRNSDFYESGYTNNILDEDFYKQLSPGDTLLLREFFVLYEK